MKFSFKKAIFYGVLLSDICREPADASGAFHSDRRVFIIEVSFGKARNIVMRCVILCFFLNLHLARLNTHIIDDVV